jgi:archaemetzincin
LEFERGDRVVPSAERRTIFILPIGAFPERNTPSLPLLADYAQRFFGLDAQVLPAADESDGLGARRRIHYGVQQLFSKDLLGALQARLPSSAYGLVGVTMSDLFPDPSWNFVFGEARFSDRVGVYSFARYDPAFHREPRGPNTEHKILERSLKVMSHEIGHMFGIAHCTAYRCLMNGSNSLDETDGSPMHVCPVCLRKLHIAVGFSPAARYAALLDFYAAHGFEAEATWTRERLAHLHAR